MPLLHLASAQPSSHRFPTRSWARIILGAGVSGLGEQRCLEKKHLLTLCITAANIQLKRKLGFTDVLC